MLPISYKWQKVSIADVTLVYVDNERADWLSSMKRTRSMGKGGMTLFVNGHPLYKQTQNYDLMWLRLRELEIQLAIIHSYKIKS